MKKTKMKILYSGFATYPSYGLSNNVLLNWLYK